MWLTWVIIGLAYLCTGGMTYAGVFEKRVLAGFLMATWFVLIILGIQPLVGDAKFYVLMGSILPIGVVGIVVGIWYDRKQRRIAKQCCAK